MAANAPIAVPDATTWTDTAGNLWTSHGADVTVTPGVLAGTVTVVRIES